MADLSVSAGKKASILDFLLTIALVIIGSLYLVVAAYSGDLKWFWPKFNSMPSQVVVLCHGHETRLEGSSVEAQALALLVNGQISGDKRFDSLNLTPPTYDYYRTDPAVVTLELVYAQPVRIHLPNMFFTNITSLLIPLEGRYADSAIIFGLIDGVPAGGSLHVQSNQPVMDHLASSGLCAIP